jgi:hypothetical protein
MLAMVTSLFADAQTAKAPTKKPSNTVTKTPAQSLTASPNTKTALPNQSTPAKSSNKATSLPSKTPAKATTNPATGGGGGNATKLPADGTTVAPSQPAKHNYSSPSKPSSSARSSYRSSSSGSSGYDFGKGDGLLNVGIGLSGYTSRMPIGASYEWGFADDISAGIQIDHIGRANYAYSVTYFGARGSYHFNRILSLNEEKLDLYAGVGLGYRSLGWGDGYNRYNYNYNSGLFFNYFIGGKYYFTEKIGAFVELGYTGISSSRIGLSVKF